ncbi:MAG: class I SAM-dependent methyltransferase [Dehalococcoidia bacterium]|nr:class I SAM-dependent methyltransferase [Dehalococcoidia bacterium]
MTTSNPAADGAAAAADAKQAFAERLFGDALGMMNLAGVYLGTTLGLYEAMRDGVAVTSSELAERTSVTERYAREWLEHQAANGVLVLVEPSDDPGARRFALPQAHAEVLADRDDLDFLGWLGGGAVAGFSRLPDVAEAFRTGRGVPWEAFGDGMRFMQGDANRPLFLHALGQEFLPNVPDVHARLSEGARVAEVGSGLGWAAIGLARAYPNVTVDGYDIDGPSVEYATQHAQEHGVADRVAFHAVDASTVAGQYDLVTAFECIHDMPRPVEVLSTMRSMVAPGGAVIVMDERADEAFQAPASDVDRYLYGFSLLVCLPDGLSTEGSVGTGTVMRPATFRQYALDAGFREVEVLEDLDHPFFRFYRLHP